MKYASPRRQQGLAAVEFAVVGVLALTTMFGCIEIARYYSVLNAVAEATRRAARVAVVTTGTTAAKAAATVLATDITGLTAANVSVVYSDASGAVAASADPAGFVTVSITGYTYTLLIPGLSLSVAVPAFSTTLPAESLGIVPSS